MFHIHKWKEIKRVFQKSNTFIENARGTEDFIEKIIFGMTVIEHQCSECGELKHYEVTGNVANVKV